MMISERGRGAPPLSKPMNTSKPRRLSVTIPDEVMRRLVRCADEQGRSTSNLAAYLLENSLQLAQSVPSARRELWAR